MTKEAKIAPEASTVPTFTSVPTALWTQLIAVGDSFIANPTAENKAAYSEAQSRALAGVAGVPYREYKRGAK